MKRIIDYIKTLSITRLFLSILIIITVFSFITYFFLFRSVFRNRFLDSLYEANAISSEGFANQINSYFVSTNGYLNTIESAIDNFDTLDKETLDHFFSESIDDTLFPLNFELLNQNGIVTYTYPTNLDAIGIDRHYENYILNSVLNEVYWSRPYVSLHSELTISISFKTDEYYFVGHLPLSYTNTIYTEYFGLDTTKNLMILDEYHIYIFDSKTTNDDIRLPYPNIEDLEAIHNSDKYRIFDVNGEKSIVSQADIPFTNWHLYIYESVSVANQLVNQTFLSLSIFIIVFIMILSTTFFLLINGLSNHLKRFETGLKQIASGNMSYEFDYEIFKELKILSHGLNKMSQDLLESRTKLENIAYRDSLTGLPTRTMLKNILDEYMLEKNYRFTLIYFDLIRFSIINESYGFSYGDLALKEICRKVSSIIPKNWGFYRVESDEFIFLAPSDDHSYILEKLRALDDEFVPPFLVENIFLNISFRYGVNFPPHQNDTFEMMLNQCKKAIEAVTIKSPHNYEIYNHDLEPYYERRIEIELSLEEALQNNGFSVYFQPIVDYHDGSIRGFEALSRWFHPKIGFVSPSDFIPILEKTYKIHRLDYRVIEESIRLTSILSKQFNRDFVISCNITVDTLTKPGFVSFVKKTLTQFEFPPSCLELEITESTIIQDFEKTKQILDDLTNYGVKFSEDDFGDGFSSLNYLTKLDFRTIKISRSLILDVKENEKNLLLVRSILKLTKDLNFDTILEGVEDLETLELFKESGCKYVQGFYFYKPMPFYELEDTLKRIYQQ